jgi:ubiquinone/menaquinone biosynthesis C-methylase UbiE
MRVSETKQSHLDAQAAVHSEIAHLYSLERVERTVFNRAFNEYWNDLALSLLPSDHEVRVLDLMGGTGLLSQALIGAGFQNVTLLDLSVDMLGFAKTSMGSKIRSCAADAMQLPFCAASFDVVICRGGLHHLPDIPAAMREVERVLKPQGDFLAFDPCDDWPPIRWLRSAMYHLFRFFDEENERGLRSAELQTAADSVGFDEVHIRKFGFAAYTISGIEAHLFPRLFARLPRMTALAGWLISIERWLEGRSFLLAMALRATKRRDSKEAA